MNNYLLNISIFAKDSLSDDIKNVIDGQFRVFMVSEYPENEIEVCEVLDKREPDVKTITVMIRLSEDNDGLPETISYIDKLSCLLEESGISKEDSILFPTIMKVLK